MPYITLQDRSKFEKTLDDLPVPENAGELNFLVTRICHEYLKSKGLKYENVNSVVGALECCKFELYRRIAAPYEDTKIIQNGDVSFVKD